VQTPYGTVRKLITLWLAVFALIIGALATFASSFCLIVWIAGRLGHSGPTLALGAVVCLGAAASLATATVVYVHETRRKLIPLLETGPVNEGQPDP
jgi:hypothetical protein